MSAFLTGNASSQGDVARVFLSEEITIAESSGMSQVGHIYVNKGAADVLAVHVMLK